MKLVREFVSFNRAASAWVSRRFPRAFANPQPTYRAVLMDRVTREIKDKRPAVLLEVGGVDRPLLSRSTDYEFIGLDIDERPECASLYDRFVVQSVEDPLPGRVDMIISFTLLEHVPDNTAAIKAMYRGLNAGGSIHHYVPSGLHPYSLALRAIGARLQRRLIPMLRPGAEDVTGYPAYFDLCTPRAMTEALVAVGFAEIDLQPFYRANDYFAFFTPAFIVITLYENVCRRLGLRALASGFVVSARKPSDEA